MPGPRLFDFLVSTLEQGFKVPQRHNSEARSRGENEATVNLINKMLGLF